MQTTLIEYDFESAKKEIKAAWNSFCEMREPAGLELGRVCSDWCKKFKRTKNNGFSKICGQLCMTAGEVQFWMDKYAESVGDTPVFEEPELELPTPEARKNQEEALAKVTQLERLFPKTWNFHISINCGGNFNVVFSAIKEEEVREIAKKLDI